MNEVCMLWEFHIISFLPSPLIMSIPQLSNLTWNPEQPATMLLFNPHSVLIPKEKYSVPLESHGGFYKLKVSRSRNIKHKIYEMLTTPKIQTNGVILYSCIDQVCLCFDRLLLLDLLVVQVLHTIHTYYVAAFQHRKKFICSLFGRSFGITILFRDLLTFTILM